MNFYEFGTLEKRKWLFNKPYNLKFFSLAQVHSNINDKTINYKKLYQRQLDSKLFNSILENSKLCFNYLHNNIYRRIILQNKNLEEIEFSKETILKNSNLFKNHFKLIDYYKYLFSIEELINIFSYENCVKNWKRMPIEFSSMCDKNILYHPQCSTDLLLDAFYSNKITNRQIKNLIKKDNVPDDVIKSIYDLKKYTKIILQKQKQFVYRNSNSILNDIINDVQLIYLYLRTISKFIYISINEKENNVNSITIYAALMKILSNENIKFKINNIKIIKCIKNSVVINKDIINCFKDSCNNLDINSIIDNTIVINLDSYFTEEFQNVLDNYENKNKMEVYHIYTFLENLEKFYNTNLIDRIIEINNDFLSIYNKYVDEIENIFDFFGDRMVDIVCREVNNRSKLFLVYHVYKRYSDKKFDDKILKCYKDKVKLYRYDIKFFNILFSDPNMLNQSNEIVLNLEIIDLKVQFREKYYKSNKFAQLWYKTLFSEENEDYIHFTITDFLYYYHMFNIKNVYILVNYIITNNINFSNYCNEVSNCILEDNFLETDNFKDSCISIYLNYLTEDNLDNFLLNWENDFNEEHWEKFWSLYFNYECLSEFYIHTKVDKISEKSWDYISQRENLSTSFIIKYEKKLNFTHVLKNNYVYDIDLFKILANEK